MSPAKRDSSGRWHLDWTAIIILLITVIISAGGSAIGAYYSFQFVVGQHETRLNALEGWKCAEEKQVNEHLAGVSGREMRDQWAMDCITELRKEVKEIRVVLDDIRKDQVRRQKYGY